MPDYSRGVIYTLRCLNDPNVYVGSTIQTLAVRMGGHRKHYYKNKVLGKNKEIVKDINDWKIELHELYPCLTKQELHRREGEVIREIGTLNKNIAGRTKKEYYIENADKNKEYYIENIDKIKENNKKYRIKNADKIKENEKEYRIENVDKLKEYFKQHRIENADKIKEKNKEYRIDNTDKIKEYKKEYYIKNADKRKKYRIENTDKTPKELQSKKEETI